MKKKSMFCKEERWLIKTYLKNGLKAKDLGYFMYLAIDGYAYLSFDALPEEAQLEIHKMEAEIYLQDYPDVTKEERKLTLKWVRKNRSVYTNESCTCDDKGYPLDYISDLRLQECLWKDYDPEQEAAAIEPVKYDDPNNDDDLPF